MDTITIIEELTKLESNEARIAFVENELNTNEAFKVPFYGRIYAANPRCLLFMLQKDGQISDHTAAEYFLMEKDYPTTPEVFNRIAKEVNELRGH
jgi:hypothetical protein